MDQNKKERVGVVMTSELKEKAKIVAEMEHRNLSNLMVTLLYDYVAKKLPDDNKK